jgi:hypothetical protein
MSDCTPQRPAARSAGLRPARRRGRGAIARALGLAVAVAGIVGVQSIAAAQPHPERPAASLEPQTLIDAQRLFYNARYEAAAALTVALRAPNADDLASDELHSSALLFQLKALLERPGDKDALKTCAPCPDLITDFLADIRRGQASARAILQVTPDDETALFFLGKLDLNYVWLQLGPLKKRTGWSEYWEARHSLDAVLKRNPRHVRARIARAWIDYIVDTKMPWSTRWLLGGGNKKQALLDVRDASQMDADFFSHTEAEFALWDMHVREREMTQATEIARKLARDFPDNRSLASFLEARIAAPSR